VNLYFKESVRVATLVLGVVNFLALGVLEPLLVLLKLIAVVVVVVVVVAVAETVSVSFFSFCFFCSEP
jgi:hypothetical protein